MATHAAVATRPLAAHSEPEPHKLVMKPTAKQFWSLYMRSVMTPLLKATGSYTPYDQASHMQFIDDHVVQYLGPLPTEPHMKYTAPSAVVGCPVDISLNFTSGGKTKVRFDYDMLAPADRTGPDPFGEAAARDMLRGLAVAVNADTTWLETFFAAMHLTPSELEAALAKIPKDLIMPPCMAGFDLDGPKRTLKAYFPAMRKALAVGKSSADILLQTMRRLEGAPGLAPSLDLIEGYLANCKNDAKLMLVGIDCVAPKNSRIKCYLHTSSNSFGVVHDIMTLGGRLNNENSLERVEILRTIWPLMLNEPENTEFAPDDTRSKPERITGTGFSGILITVELAPGNMVPDTKIYVPLFQYNKNSEEAEKNVEAILKKLGHEWGRRGTYRTAMAAVFGCDRVYGQVYITFSYTKTRGSYVTSYIAKPIEHDGVGLDQFVYI